MKLYENEYFFVEKEDSTIPWVKIFSQKKCKELSDCDETTRDILLKAMVEVEKAMIKFYNPTKINIAMFGNYVPHLHIHIMARFENDTHFPEPMWGKKQRDSKLELPSFEEFSKILVKVLDEI